MTSKNDASDNLLHMNSLPITPPAVNCTSTTNIGNHQNSEETLRICIKHTEKEYFFFCPEKMCMHQVENDKHKIKDHIIEFHSKKADLFNLKEDNNVFCFYCSKCNRYSVTMHYHCPHCPKWELTTFKSLQDMKTNHIHTPSEIISLNLRKPNNWSWW